MNSSDPIAARLLRYAPPVAIVALPILIFHKLIFSGLVLARGDVYAYFYPYWAARSAAFMRGEIPLWSPEIFMGVPLLANSQIGTFYPPNWLVTPFSTPQAVAISIVLHMIWAMWGVYLLGRRTMGLSAFPALLAGIIFALSGCLSAQVEHINQLQALTWMPWLFMLVYQAGNPALPRRAVLFNAGLLAAGLALQLLAGHPQTVFITLVGLAIYALVGVGGLSPRRIVRVFLIVGGCGLVALLLTSLQLIPTLELASVSNRSGGLEPQQAMAFSLNPFVIGRGLLPSYDSVVFGEYVAYLGVIGLGLALVGMINGGTHGERLWTRRPAWVVITLVGFALALGLYNPLYWTLASLPGFSFFRVPARWLALFTLGGGLLAGLGLQSLVNSSRRIRPLVFLLILAVTGGLAAASFLTDRMPEDVIGSALPTTITLIGWMLALLTLLLALWATPRLRVGWRAPLLCSLVALELFLASRVMPYNELAPPDTYSGQRFTISQLRAYSAQQTPPGRVLSISNLLFDPGDVAALTARYQGAGMSPFAVRIALVATKLRETLAANLPLVWGVHSVDGFDGGLLPTGDYSAFTSLMLPPGEMPSTDGRLREILAQEACRGACIPKQRWLNLSGTRYLITDKVYDLWHADVAYDTQFEIPLDAGGSTQVRNVPEFVATTLDVLYRPTLPDAEITLTYADGLTEIVSLPDEPDTIVDIFALSRLELDSPRAPVAISLNANAPITLVAMTLVDTRTGDFQQLTMGNWQRVLSSDIKMYENLDVLPRAFLVYQALQAADTNAALDIMRDPAFDPAQTVVLEGDNAQLAENTGLDGSALIISYTAERVEIQVESSAPAYLILTDAHYPGWVASVNGTTTDILKANIMFRAVPVPAGASLVIFEYHPAWWPLVFVIGGMSWSVLLLAGFIIWQTSRKS